MASGASFVAGAFFLPERCSITGCAAPQQAHLRPRQKPSAAQMTAVSSQNASEHSQARILVLNQTRDRRSTKRGLLAGASV